MFKLKEPNNINPYQNENIKSHKVIKQKKLMDKQHSFNKQFT